MCGRFTLSAPAEVVAELFELAETPVLAPRFNIAPTQPAPVVLWDGEAGQRRLEAFHWGLIPSWAKDPAIGNRMINARAETAATKPAFRSAFRDRRCLVLADGFYEWQKVERAKRPFYFRMRDGRPFAFAGLWERWDGPDGETIDSCTILTTEPNEVVRAVHDRMPVILARKECPVWLDPQNREVDKLQSLLQPCPPEQMEAYPVSKRVNNPANEGPGCVAPLQ
jgi:putative SOS response-associated peptidase YedK